MIFLGVTSGEKKDILARVDIDRCQSAEILSGRLSSPIGGCSFTVCFCFVGLVGAFGAGFGFKCGEAAPFAADLAVGGFSGPGARPVIGRDVNAFAGLGPMFGFFHRAIVAAQSGHRLPGLHPMAYLLPWRHLAPMQIPDNFSNGAVAAGDAVRGNEMEEPLFGDPRWVDERLQALHKEPEGEG